MNDMPLRALLVFSERRACQQLHKAIAAAGAIDCELVEIDQLDATLQRLKQEKLDIILVDPDQSTTQLVKTVVRARESAPGVPVFVLPEMRNGTNVTELLRRAASRGMDAARPNGNPVAWAMGYADRVQQMDGELLRLALRDDLTGLYNRRGFTLIADEYRKTACRMKQQLLLFFADLDGLKQINDHFGHGEGDRALVRAAESFKKTFRGYDIVARLGGDEFTALVVERPGRSAEAISRRLQESLAQCTAKENRYHLSLSMGVARFDPDTAPTLQELVRQADEALYQQKRNKRASPLENSPAMNAHARDRFSGGTLALTAALAQ